MEHYSFPSLWSLSVTSVNSSWSIWLNSMQSVSSLSGNWQYHHFLYFCNVTSTFWLFQASQGTRWRRWRGNYSSADFLVHSNSVHFSWSYDDFRPCVRWRGGGWTEYRAAVVPVPLLCLGVDEHRRLRRCHAYERYGNQSRNWRRGNEIFSSTR